VSQASFSRHNWRETERSGPKIISLIGQSQCQMYVYIYILSAVHTRARTHRARNSERRDRDPYRKRQGASVLREDSSGRPRVIFFFTFADMSREV
jgi:hypothetical protein